MGSGRSKGQSSVLEVEAKFATSAIMKRIRIGGMQN